MPSFAELDGVCQLQENRLCLVVSAWTESQLSLQYATHSFPHRRMDRPTQLNRVAQSRS